MSFELFENLEYQNVNNLYKLIVKDSSYLDTVKIQYSRNNPYLQETLNFLIEVNLIKVKNNSIIILDSSEVQMEIKLFKKISENPNYGLCVKSYLNNFLKNDNNEYVFKPDSLYNSLTSHLRNFLITSKKINYIEGQYKIVDTSILNIFKKKEFSPEALKKMQEKQGQIGLEAEILVYKNEVNKLKKLNTTLQVDHISLRDVSAGYDILSYKKNNDNFEKIFIEVKAVSRSNYTFHLSVQELQTAKRYKGSYYIYLLPVDPSKKEGFDLDKILKINNINQNIINNKTDWCIDNDGYLITRIG